MIWFDGQILSSSKVRFDVADRGLLLSDGLFETVLVARGVPFRFDAHLARLRSGAGLLRLTVDLDAVARAVTELAERLDEPSIVRVTVTRGPGPRGLGIPPEQTPSILATLAPWSSAAAFVAQRLWTSRIRRNDASPLSNVKSLAYLDNVLAFDEAAAAGCSDALLLSTRDRVACTAAANVFIVRGNRLLTPPLSDGALPGTMRALLLTLAEGCGLQPREQSLTVTDLREADAVLTTNTVRLLSPAVSLDQQPLRKGRRDLFLRLAQAFCDSMEAECRWKPPLPETAFGG